MKKATGLIALTLFSPLVAGATSTNMSLTTKVVISSGCTVTASNLSFGVQSTIKTNIDAKGLISVNCSSIIPYYIGLSQGTYGSSVTSRKMKVSPFDTNAISYSLFKDASRTQVWGDTLGVNTFANFATTASHDITVYARLPAQPTVAPGFYTDILNVIVTY